MEKVKRKITYRLYPSARQQTALSVTLRLHQQLYNAALEHRINAYKKRGKSIGFYDQCSELTDLRREIPDYASINAQSCQVTLKRLDLAFGAFFRRVKSGDKKAGFPRFKAYDRYSGFGYKTHGDGWKLLSGNQGKNGFLRLSGIGQIKLRGKAKHVGVLKTCEIQHKQGAWYASITLKCSPARVCGEQAIGIDWGLETFATIAKHDGGAEEIANPRILRKHLKALQVKQRSLSRKKRGSQNRTRAKLKVAKLHSQVANARKEFMHQMTAKIVKSSSLIAVEQLNVKGMSSHGGSYKKGLNREILSAAPGMFHQMLKYKAEEAGIEWVSIATRAVKPSQTCHRCGHQAKKKLCERRHVCACGADCSRDENAARVILHWALFGNATGQELAGCGELALADSGKHETPSISAYLS
jgi:putative transposase